MTTLWTIGHSTRSAAAFANALTAFGIARLVDVRRFPTSKRHPQFATDALRRSLHGAGVRYEWLGDELGGMRDRKTDSRHVGLADSSFQGYADWMDMPAFARGVERLVAWARASPTAVMCAERNPKGCHRRLLSDHVLLVRGLPVVHILDAGASHPHEPTPGARRTGAHIHYLSPDAAATVESFDDPT